MNAIGSDRLIKKNSDLLAKIYDCVVKLPNKKGGPTQYWYWLAPLSRATRVARPGQTKAERQLLAGCWDKQPAAHNTVHYMYGKL